MRCSTRSFGVVSTVAVVLAAAACTDSPTTPNGATALDAARSSAVEADVPNSADGVRSLAVCPTPDARSASAVIDPDVGGTVSVDGGSITLPAGAVSEPTEIALTVPRSRHAVLDIRANGREHFEFDRPVAVTIDYSRCPRPVTGESLEVWVVDTESWTLVENLGGEDDKESRSITAETTHLSELTIAT